MKSALAAALATATVVSAAWLRPATEPAPVAVSIQLVDGGTNRPVPGVIRLRAHDGQVVAPAALVSRGWGLDRSAPISQWHALPGPARLELPPGKFRIEAQSGIETLIAVADIDVEPNGSREIKLPIRSFSNLKQAGWYAANSHLHLRNLSREESDRYLREIPAADRLDLLFISYLERAEDDRSYITNQYPIGRLADFDSTGVLLSNGEEHRHNFGPQGEGYGHVMLLGIRELVRPVSIGAGISRIPPDWPPIRAGIDNAREQGGTAIWCHNNWGFEDIPNWLAGRLDAQNIFDGGSHGGYAESFYRYLNAGLRVPFSTGTDWFMYDYSRCYARVAGELTLENWLAALKAGRTFITNGPLIEFTAGGLEPGGTLNLADAAAIPIRAAVRGRVDFGRLELVRNGQVIGSAAAQPRDGYFEAKLEVDRTEAEPCWLAARVSTTALNEYGQRVFAHSSPVYVTQDGRGVQVRADVEFLKSEVQAARDAIAARADFARDSQRDDILRLYDDAIRELQRRLAQDQD